MGNSSSNDKPPPPREDEDIVDEKEEAPSPPEPVNPPEETVDKSELPLPDDAFNLGLESNYDEVKADILKKSEDEGKQYIYRDGDFPGEWSSLYFSANAQSRWKDLEWKRPNEISTSPRLLKDSVSDDDVIQGGLGDCWWLSSCAAICRQEKYMKRLIPSDQTMKDEGYVGMFHFHFWRFGKWVDVIIDDELPVKYGKPAFGRCNEKDEFWLPLMEKAYAKLLGSYEAMEGGFTQDALEDLTGGIAINFKLGSDTPDGLYKKLLKAYRNDSFICAGIEGSQEVTDTRTGLVSSHAYTVTMVKKAKHRGRTANLIRIRNPWGNQVEWKGAWSDGSSKWDEVDENDKARLEYADADNGEWWMEFDDFKYYFSDVTICTIGPDFDEDGAGSGDKWYMKQVKGQWIKGYSAGGCRNEVDKFATNPQYYVHLPQADVFDPVNDEPEEEGKCSMIIGLMQEYRKAGKNKGIENNYIGLTAYKVKERPRGKLDVNFMKYNRDYAESGKYVNMREVTITEEFDPGHYVIIPATFYSDKPGSFLIRFYTESVIDIEELH